MQTDNPPQVILAACNLIAMIIVGLSLSWWILYYTDYFPVVLGLLGLGGFFAWIAFVINILSDERKKQFQRHFDELILQNKLTIIVLMGALATSWVIFAPSYGTLLVDSLDPARGHTMEIWRIDNGKPNPAAVVERLVVPPHSSPKILLGTEWHGATRYYVKLSRLPGIEVSVDSLKRTKLLVPDMLLERTVIFARPSAKYSGPVSDGYSLQLLINNELVETVENYRGESLWIGASDDVAVPDYVSDQWLEEFVRSKLDTKPAQRWMRPMALKPYLELKPGDTITVRLIPRAELTLGNPNVKYIDSLSVPQAGSSRRFPEQLILEEAH